MVTKKAKRIKAFDGMRGLAAVIVMIFHVITWTKIGHAANYSYDFPTISWKALTVTPLKLLWSGNEAVILFYIIGGFVVAKPYIEGRDLDFLSFFKKRFSRLVLPYWLVLVVTLVFIGIFGGLKEVIDLSGGFNVKWSSFPSVTETIGQFLLWDSNVDVTAGAFWSIVQEWRVSLLMPFVGVLLGRYSTRWVVAGTVAANSVLNVLLVGAPSLHRTNYYFIFFFIGAVLAKHLDEMREWFGDVRWLGVLLPVLIPFQWVMVGFGVDVSRRVSLLPTAVGFVLLILLVIDSKRLTAWFESPWLQFLGGISFSLYLTHTTVIVLFVTLS